jgi:hypothetical protein
VKLARDPETGQFLEGHEGLGGRPPGSQNKFPTHYIRTMRELIAGRIKELVEGEKDPVALSKIIAQLYFDGLQGKVEIRHGDKTMTVSPAIFLKLFQDWASGDQDRRLKRAVLGHLSALRDLPPARTHIRSAQEKPDELSVPRSP